MKSLNFQSALFDSLSMLFYMYTMLQGPFGLHFCEATLQDPHAALRAASSSETCNLVARMECQQVMILDV